MASRLMPKRDAEKTQRRILTVAKQEFAKKGYTGARMKAISEKAGINKALLHYYFDSKQKLYGSLLKSFLAVEEMPYLEEQLRSFMLTPPEKLYVVLYIQIKTKLYIYDSDLIKILSHEINNIQDKFKDLIRELFTKKIKLITQIINEGLEKGYFETPDPTLYAFNVVFFFLSIVIKKDLFQDSEIGKRLYNNNQEQLMSFIIDNFFKSLNRNDRVYAPPMIGKDCRRIITEVLEKVDIEIEKKIQR